jgi:hypothetical protein
LDNRLNSLKIYRRGKRGRPEMVLLAPAAVEEGDVTQAGPSQISQSLFRANPQPVVTPSAEIDPEAVADLVLEMLEADLRADYERRGGGFNS